MKINYINIVVNVEEGHNYTIAKAIEIEEMFQKSIFF